jgi:hypothetical protein
MCSRVVRVNEIGTPSPHQLANASRRGEVPIAAHAYRRRGQPVCAKPPDERRLGMCYHQRFITPLALRAGQEVHLALTAPPLPAGVDV